MPVWAILEDRFECILVNARHVKQVPGRKTDVKDAQWLCQLLEAGLLRGSFVPPKPIRTLRNLTRYRKTQIADRQREANRLHKILEDTGIKLGTVASDILGKSGRDMLDALVQGTTDPNVLADLARGQLRKKIPALREALVGRFHDEHALIVGQILAHIDFLDEAIDRLSCEIEEQIAPFAAQRDLLMSIPGVKQRAAEVLISEIGVDMTAFPTPKHLASWAKVSPGNDQSAGRRRSGKTGKGNKWLRATLNESANAAARSKDTYLAGPVPAPARPSRPQQSRHRGRALDPHHRLAHAHHRRAVPRPRWRLLHPPEPRPDHQTPRPPARSARAPGHPRTKAAATNRRLTEAPQPSAPVTRSQQRGASGCRPQRGRRTRFRYSEGRQPKGSGKPRAAVQPPPADARG